MNRRRPAARTRQRAHRGIVELAPDVVFGRDCVFGGSEGPTVVERGCILGDSVRLDGGVRLGAQSRIGDYVRVGHPSKATSVGRDVSATSERVRDLLIESASAELGAGSLVRSHSIIYSHVRFGARLSTGHHVLIREHTTVGDRCVFGSFSGCDGYVSMGDDVQIGQGTYLGQSARLGHAVFLGAHTALSDNRYMIRTVQHDLFGPVIEDFVRVGMQCVILSGVRIGRDSIIGASSLVTKDVPAGVLALGSPCRVVRDLEPTEIEEYHRSVRAAADPIPPRAPASE